VAEIRGQVERGEGSVYLDKLFNKAALNVVWNLVSGTRYGYQDQRMHRLLGTPKYNTSSNPPEGVLNSLKMSEVYILKKNHMRYDKIKIAV
jgi:hypothetical protein